MESKEIVPVDRGVVCSQNIDPSDVLIKGIEQANKLKKVIEEQGLARHFGGSSKHVDLEGWQIAAAFDQASCKIVHESVRPVVVRGEIVGFKAYAEVYDKHGKVVSAQEGYCMRSEPNWARKPDFALIGMAQTRAQSRALRGRYAWIMKIAGYESTPAEEMEGVDESEMFAPEPTSRPQQAQQTSFKDSQPQRPIGGPGRPASDKQKNMIRAISKSKGMTKEELQGFAEGVIGKPKSADWSNDDINQLKKALDEIGG